MVKHIFTTGYAYAMKEGKIRLKIDINPGEHEVSPDYTIFDCDKAAFDAAIVITDPKPAKITIEDRLKKLEDDMIVVKSKVA